MNVGDHVVFTDVGGDEAHGRITKVLVGYEIRQTDASGDPVAAPMVARRWLDRVRPAPVLGRDGQGRWIARGAT